MAKRLRSYSNYAIHALKLFGSQIEIARKEKKITAEAMALRCNMSRNTLRKVENGDPGVEIGLYFEAAFIVGLQLFKAEDKTSLAQNLNQNTKQLQLLPERIRKVARKGLNNAF